MRITDYKGYDLNNRIAVMGEVNRPGIFYFGNQTDLLESISFAEGHKSSANLKSIVLIRKGYAQDPQFHLINAENILNGKNLSQNVSLAGGDIVFVPKTFIASVGEFVQYFFANIKPAADTYLSYYDTFHAGKRYPK